MNSSGKAEIKDEFCIGCGHCYYQCSPGAFELIEDERNIFLPMQDKSQARIKSEVLEEDTSDDLVVDKTAVSNRNEVLETLNNFRQKFEAEENIKTFKDWTKTLQYYFTDLDEYWYFELKEGVPSELKEGRVDKPDIYYEWSGTVYMGVFRGEVDFIKAMNKGIIKVEAPIKDLIKMGKIV
jgi:NAD-dependent dihydropyrimidine dehydrogenase PreA subunit